MLRLSVRDEEFLMIGDDVKIVFLGSSGGQTRIMIDAPKEVNIVRSKAIEKRIQDPELLTTIPKYYKNPEGAEKKKSKATTLGIKGVKVDGADDTSSLSAIDTSKAAIQKVSTQRSALGAVQNRLEHTINNLDNVVENTTSAESQIRDTDMATEMVKYSNNNILAQAGQAMLAQANQSNQGVLSLLQ